jgi:hypothetical protein
MSTVHGQVTPGGSPRREPADLKLEEVALGGADGTAMIVEDHRK